MKVIMSDLKQYCVDQFGSDWRLVFDFYSKTVQVDCTTSNPDYKKKEKAKKNMYLSSNDRRLRHIKSLVEEYDKDIIIKAIYNFQNKEKTGELGSLSMSYFGGFVKNEQLKKFQKNVKKPVFGSAPADPKPTIQKFENAILMLEKYEKIDNSTHEHLNWSYRCSCGAIFEWDEVVYDGGKATCPKCHIFVRVK